MFRKLRNKVMLFNMLTVSLVILAAFAVIYFVTYRNIERENGQRLQAVSGMFLMPNRNTSDDIANPNRDFPTEAERFSVEYGVSFVLFVNDGQLENVNSQLDLEDSVYMEAFEKTAGAESGKITLADRKWIFAIAPDMHQLDSQSFSADDPQYTRVVFLDITNSVKILRTLMITLTCVGLAVLLVLLGISYRFAINAVRPIEENFNRQKQFIADASHELRTPLAVIGTNIDAIMTSGEETVNSQKEWFAYIRSELRRIGKLVDDLLYLAKSENIRREDNLPFDLSAVCETVCASMEAMLYENGKSLKTDIAKDIPVAADSEKIKQVLYILLDNADKYTPKGGKISVTLIRENNKAVVRVINSGDGISAADLPKIFDRFYRADVSRSTDTGGAGLGLSIAKTIVENSGGTITAESGNGITIFEVRLRWIKSSAD